MMKSLHYWAVFIDYISVSALIYEWHEEDEGAVDQLIGETERSPTDANAEVILVLAISCLVPYS
jgi:hypothetical protein